MTEYLEFLKATVDKPIHACRLVSKVEQTETKLETLYAEDFRHMRGIGVSVRLNDRNVHLLLDTGAGGIMVGRKVAEKAGLTRISAVHYGGIDDKGLQSGYTAVADHIRIGELEFQDCVVAVSDQRWLADEDGLIGADVFGAYLIDLDLPGERLKLSPLPKRPEDTMAPKSLNSEGEEQANAEQKEDNANEQTSKDQKPSAPASQTAHRLPRDRYVAPEMVNWTKVFRFSHAILVPTSVNDSKPMLFGLDTGGFTNILSLRAGRQVAKVSSDYRDRVSGLNGEVNKVYSSDKVTLSFGHFRQSNLGIITLDLSTVSRHTGTEVSGFLGFAMLRRLELKLDYRDGLVDFVYEGTNGTRPPDVGTSGVSGNQLPTLSSPTPCSAIGRDGIPAEILTDTMGVDFSPYMTQIVKTVRQNWYNIMPPSVYPPISKQGKLTIEFQILKDGTVSGLMRDTSSGDVALDRAAWGSISTSTPFPPLPKEFPGKLLGMRFYFFYNLKPTDISISISPCVDVRVPAGSTLQFSALGEEITDTSVTWSVSGPGCSKSDCGTISDGGLYTAPANIPTPPTVVVEAKSRSDPSVTGKTRLTVVKGSPSPAQ